MADPPLDVAAAQEELTVQQVILQSLESESFDGVEEEKREAEKEIQRLSSLLAAQGTLGQGQHEPHRVAHLDDQAASGPSAFSPYASPGGSHGLPFHHSPAGSRGLANMASPTGHNLWDTPNSQSLPSRKRDLGATTFSDESAQNKSRRTTPTPSRPSDDPFSASSRRTIDSFDSSGLDIIDLTGDDVQEDATAVSARMKLDQRREQERQDRELAFQLSSQGSPPRNKEQVSPQNNALRRIMDSQRANARQRQPGSAQQHLGSSGWSGPTGSPHLGNPSPLPSSYAMPGAYDSTWDDPFNSRSLGSTPQPTLPSQQLGYYPMNPTQTNFAGFGGARTINRTPGQFPHPSGSNGSAYYGANPINFELAAPYDRFNSAAALLHGPPTLQSQGSLSGIINRTSNIDYVNGLDGFGNPLSQRIGEYIQDAIHDTRVSDKELDDLLQNIRPDMDIPEKNRGGTPAGLKSALYAHQEVALTWMKKMEDGTNKGGILADDMGLGKTISALALMISRPSKSRPKTNLIVGPLSLVRQWEEEIRKKLKLSHKMSVFVYHNVRATVDDLAKYDVVLTTYGTLAQELKKLEKFHLENAGRNIDFNDRALASKCPLLHPKKAVFHRIILDEAQCIKNKSTKTAQACFKLKATYRWCLTGTPMMNSVEELYSLLHFLQIKPYCQWEKFREAFGRLFGKRGDSKHTAMSRLRALLKAVMLRRKKNSMLDGKPILRLPEKTEEIVYAELSQEERDFYGQLEKKSQVLFSQYLRDGSIGKNYSNILVLLLRMRQACCHPHLNLDVEDAGPVTDENALELAKSLDPVIARRIKEAQSFDCPICYDAVQAPSFIIPCGHDTCKACLIRVVENAAAHNLQEGNESTGAKCPVCRGHLDPAKTFSYEAFRTVYMPETMQKSESDDELSDLDSDDSASDDDDADDVDNRGNLRGFIVNDDRDDSEEDEKKPIMDQEQKPSMKEEKQPVKAEDGDNYEEKKPLAKVKKGKGKKSKGKKKKGDIKPSMLKTLRQAASKNQRAYKTYMSYLRRTWMPAAKVTECMRLLKDIQATGEKTIVFSQWTLLLDLLDVAMHHEKFDHKPLRYDGSMSGQARNDTARDFREKPGPRVMLVSLRAGNAGLNLTAASRVIIMDPFWNPYIEMQAVDRAYRIGQQKPVKVYRVLTKETVEDRIVALQEKKKEIVEAALDESESMKIGRLSVNELKFLFNGSSNS